MLLCGYLQIIAGRFRFCFGVNACADCRDIDPRRTLLQQQLRTAAQGIARCQDIIRQNDGLTVCAFARCRKARRIFPAFGGRQVMLPHRSGVLLQQIAAQRSAEVGGDCPCQQLRMRIALYPPALFRDRNPCDTGNLLRRTAVLQRLCKQFACIIRKSAAAVLDRQDAGFCSIFQKIVFLYPYLFIF